MQKFLLFFSLGLGCINFTHAQVKVQLWKFDNCKSSDTAAVRKLVEACRDINTAEHILQEQCSFNKSSMYKLYCNSCSPIYIRKPIDNKEEFSTESQKRGRLASSKGDFKVYNLLQLRNILMDSVAIFDSLTINISGMPETDRAKAQTLFWKTGSKKYFPPYNASQKAFIFSRQVLAEGDSNSISGVAGYLDQGIEKTMPRSFHVFFISDKEKESLYNIAIELKECDREVFSTPAGIEYLQVLVANKYGRVDVQGMMNWFSKQSL